MATITRPKLSRKELKQPDEFISSLDLALDFVSHNVTTVILAAVVLVGALAIVFAFRFYWQHQQRLAAEDFYQAVSALDRKDYAAARQGFTQLAEGEPGQTLGRLSSFYLGSIYLDQGQSAKAREALTVYLGANGDNSQFTQLALCQLGVANENLGDFAQARDAYARAAAIQGPQRARAELGGARMLVRLGDRKGAVAAYQAFLRENPFAMERPSVVEALADLGAVPDSVASTSKTIEVPAPASGSGAGAATPSHNIAATPGASTH
jgi:predicted negative regulator of RcsB-dependent stress response